MSHKLLLADDSVTIQRVIELTFADEDVTVSVVGDGQLAIEWIEAERPDIVLADIGMPKRDGYDVAAYVKSRPQLAHIPVVLLTGAFEPVDQARADAVGCDGVLAKPFEPQMVINRVKQLLGAGTSLMPKRRRAEIEPEPSAERPPVGNEAAPLKKAEAAPESPVRADAPVAATSPASPVPAAAAEPPAPASQAAQATQADASLDDYFDQLDAAFESLKSGATSGDSLAPAPGTRAAPVTSGGPDRDRPGHAKHGKRDERDRHDGLDSSMPAVGPRAAAAARGRAEPSQEFDWMPSRPAAKSAANDLNFFDVNGIDDQQQAPVIVPSDESFDATVRAPEQHPLRTSGPARTPVTEIPTADAPTVATPAPPLPVAPPPIADAFEALFAAELGETEAEADVRAPAAAPVEPLEPIAASPVPHAPVSPVVVTDALIEEICGRVLARLSDRVVRETASQMVAQVAERVVREELARIKGGAR